MSPANCALYCSGEFLTNYREIKKIVEAVTFTYSIRIISLNYQERLLNHFKQVV